MKPNTLTEDEHKKAKAWRNSLTKDRRDHLDDVVARVAKRAAKGGDPPADLRDAVHIFEMQTYDLLDDAINSCRKVPYCDAGIEQMASAIRGISPKENP